MSSYYCTLKLLLIGDISEEKEALVKRYCYNIFNPYERLTIGVDFHVKSIDLNDKKIKLQIWDVGREDRFRFLVPTYCLGANGAFLLYDITNPKTLDNVIEWTNIIRQKAGSIPIMLVGTKLDLAAIQCAVSKDYGIQVAEKNGLDSFIEISTNTGQNVDKIFEEMTELILKRMEESDDIRSKTEVKETKEPNFKKKSVKLSKRTLDTLNSSLEFLKKIFVKKAKRGF